ncbi:MAG: glycosyltransferase family 4 protein, partial [bacterium]|nr:glycosyltransferase family 4 protein [bacterium]
MKIAIEATLAQSHKTGTGKYVYHLLKTLSEFDNEHEYFLLYDNKEWKGPQFGKNFKYISYHTGSKIFSVGSRLNRLLNKINPDILHITRILGINKKAICPVITTVHDIFPILEQPRQSKIKMLFFKQLINNVTDNSDFYIFNSMFTKLEFSVFFHLPDDKGRVIYLGPSANVTPPEEKRPINGIMLCAGAIEQRRQQLFLLDVYKELLSKKEDVPPLVFIGDDRGDGEELLSNINKYNLTSKVRWEKNISRDQINKLYQNASLALQPSSYEGFGIPLTEAMSCHLPLICSDISVFREVAREYPIYARLRDKNDWVDLILKFYRKRYKTNIKLADKLLEERNWKVCAEKTLDYYKKLSNNTHKLI